VDLVERLLAGDVRALARGISLVEQDAPSAVEVLRRAFPHTGRATVIGITGSPGSGKSSLVDRLIAAYRAEDRRVGVVAVDPSSAYSGGAILGDRVRMQSHSGDRGVFIRSMATRGYLGGLSRATNDAIDLLDAAGYDPIIVETVGVGQDEVEVVKSADAVLVVLVPGMGDDIQAIKAGILEIADLFVINKADHAGADRLHAELRYMISLGSDDCDAAAAEIFQTVAVKNQGIAEVRRGIRAYLEGLDDRRRDQRRRDRAQARFVSLLTDRAVSRLLAEALTPEKLREVVDAIAHRSLDPYSAVEGVLAHMEVR